MDTKIVLKSRPEGFPSVDNFSITEEEISELQYGQVVVEVIWLSLDPYMRGRMSAAKSYALPIQIGEVITGGAVGKIIESKCPKFNVGEIIESFTIGWQKYAKINTNNIRKIDPSLAPIQTSVGVLGMPGMTAYFGLFEICKPIPGDTVVVSAASGAVGQLVGQLAKLSNCKVVGIAGNKKKCEYLTNELNFDHVINYKEQNVFKEIKETCPEGVNVYFDNVGGKILEIALSQIAQNARIVMCGGISSGYTTEALPPGPSTLTNLIIQRGRMEGFIVLDFAQRFGEAMIQLGTWVSEGKIVYQEDIAEGLENCPATLARLFEGKNFGKQLLKVADPE